MDYGYLLRRSWNIVWTNKWIVLFTLIPTLIGTVPQVGSVNNYPPHT